MLLCSIYFLFFISCILGDRDLRIKLINHVLYNFGRDVSPCITRTHKYELAFSHIYNNVVRFVLKQLGFYAFNNSIGKWEIV